MPLKLVYRTLRAVSDGALYFFYSDVHVEGDVPKDGPVIISSCHHNELIDIATLSARMPHRRMLNYWTKASLFKNPVSRFILESCGTVPVARESKGTAEDAAAARQRVFLGSFNALAGGEALGIFPEGTSYTEPRIVQVKDGVSYVALEYPLWAKTKSLTGRNRSVVLIPCAVVYTDKSVYKSRVSVRFGTPVDLAPFLADFEARSEEDAKLAITRRLTAHISSAMMQMTINAPDWETLFAARMARDILWPDERRIPLHDFVDVSQTLVDLFSNPAPSPALASVKATLICYSSLLHHARLTHAPLPARTYTHTTSSMSSQLTPRSLTRTRALLSLLSLFPTLLIRVPLSLPPVLLHTPVYLISSLARRAAGDEEEARAQLMTISGVFSMSAVNFGAAWTFWRMYKAQLLERAQGVVGWLLGRLEGRGCRKAVEDMVPAWLGERVLGAGVIFGTVWMLAYWHNLIVADGRRLFYRLCARVHIVLSAFLPSSTLPPSSLHLYTRPPPPVFNPYIKKTSLTPEDPADRYPAPPRVPTRALLPYVLGARDEAENTLKSYLREMASSVGGAREVTASGHLAVRYGGASARDVTMPAVDPYVPPSATREAREVIDFLRARGARF